MNTLATISGLLLSLTACAGPIASSPTPVAAAEEECTYEVAELGGTPTDPNPNEVRRSKATARPVRIGCR